MGCYWQIKNRLKYKGSRGFIGRAIIKNLKDTTLKTFFERAAKQGLKRGNHYDLTSSQDKENPNCIVFANTSMIFLRDLFLYPSDPDFDDLGSLEVTDVFVDECSQVVRKAKDILKVRIRFRLDDYCHLCGDQSRIKTIIEPNRLLDIRGVWICGNNHQTSGLIPKMLFGTNPTKNWGYDEFYKAAEKKIILSYRKFVPAFVWDNPNVSQAYVNSLRQMRDGSEKQRLYYGNWQYDSDPSTLCDFDAINDIFTNDHVLPGEKKYISADLAMKGRDRFVAGDWEGNVCTISIDKKISTGKQIEDDLKALMIKKEVPRSRTIVDSDGLGAYLESYLTGIKEFHGGASAIDKIEFFNLKSECGYKLAEVINKREIKVICTMEQRELLTEELVASLKEKNLGNDEKKKALVSKEEVKEQINRSPDYFDMLLMKMFFDVKPKFVGTATSLNG